MIPSLRFKSPKGYWDSMEAAGDFLRLLHGFARKFKALELLDVERSIFATMLLVCAGETAKNFFFVFHWVSNFDTNLNSRRKDNSGYSKTLYLTTFFPFQIVTAPSAARHH